jgi:hypothetical protein
MLSAVTRAADWLTSIQQSDGSLGISLSQASPRWPTAYGVLLWENLAPHSSSAKRGIKWLLQEKGRQGEETNLISHNPKLQGWPWLSDTHSWLEPTALSVLVLRRAGLEDHPRVIEGIQVILDRAIAGGGWNYGNKSVLGKDLRPQPATTGLALIALAGLEHTATHADPACGYLSDALEGVRSPMSLCWGLLGLLAWNRLPQQKGKWLKECYELYQYQPSSASQIAYALIAAGSDSWRLLRPRSKREI